MKKLFFNILTILCLFGMPLIAVADESDSQIDLNEVNEIDIKLKPSDVLFNINNMKPGDWAPRTLVIQNAGIMDFLYQMSIENKGEDKLFNELLLEIKDVQQELYNGKLSEFSSLPNRELSASSKEELEITVRFPEHLGNEFQDTDSQFAFVFTAEGTKNISEKDNEHIGNVIGGGNDHTGGSVLPNTATNLFNILLIGSILATLGILILLINRFRANSTKNK